MALRLPLSGLGSTWVAARAPAGQASLVRCGLLRARPALHGRVGRVLSSRAQGGGVLESAGLLRLLHHAVAPCLLALLLVVLGDGRAHAPVLGANAAEGGVERLVEWFEAFAMQTVDLFVGATAAYGGVE